MNITSIVLPVRVSQSAPHVILDLDNNVIAQCGSPWATSMNRAARITMLHDAETMAAELVQVINAYDEVLAALQRVDDVLVGDDVLQLVSASTRKAIMDALAAARGEPVS